MLLRSTDDASSETRDGVIVHWREYSAIDWPAALAGKVVASNYCVRKGLSRKAQLWLTCRRHLSKHPTSALAAALPETMVLETWEAFDEDTRINFGDGDIADFGADVLNVGQRLALCLADAAHAMAADPEVLWIVKPSYANKGAEIMVRDLQGALCFVDFAASFLALRHLLSSFTFFDVCSH